MVSLDQKQKREKVQKLLEDTSSVEKVYDLFAEIGYSSEVKDPSYQRDKTEFNLKEKAEDKIKNIYTVLNYQNELPVLLIETESLSKTHTDYITERLTNKFSDILIIFTIDFQSYQFILPEFEKEAPGEYDLKTTRLEIDTENVFYSDADALSKIYLEEEKRWPHVWNAWEEAFSIEKVTQQFFEDYQEQFFKIREKVLEQDVGVHDAHEFTLQFMNRLMFIYFVDKKGWLEGNGESYVKWLWKKYRKQGGLQGEEDNFYDGWLTTLFHYAFNNKYAIYSGKEKLPEEVSRSFSNAPYLNGGLFRENSLTKLDVVLEDELVGEIIENFFERYNFTIKEDSPVDKEVAVDPQMIGYVYESLSNVAEELEDLEKDSRKEFGIFYTPKEEVYFMVRRSLVEYLNNNTDMSKEKLYKLVFAETDDEKKEVREKLSETEFEEIKYKLHDMKAVDPACGSGAFLVGIIDILSQIYEEAEKKEGGSFSIFERKKQIIQESIYGVDVKDWAINASELRLFLQLLIETDIPKEEIQQRALLPNLRANLRVGDSLVQDIDGIFFDLRENKLEGLTRSHMEEIQKEKSKFFEDRSKSKYDSVYDIKSDEIKFFQRAIDDKIEELEERLKEGNEKQQTLNGQTTEPSGQEKKQITKKKNEAKKRIEKLEELKDDIVQEQDKMPMLWEVAFAEVFNNNGGFDLLIGNPPYVRSGEISPPNMDPDEVTKEDRDEYKDKLVQSVKNRMPQITDINGNSDLFIYFYFHGLSLINDEGTFCFITSNSWMDVKYGKELQEFLCKHVPIKGIYKNEKDRSFEHAEINTAISVFGAPNFESKAFGEWEIETDVWPEAGNTAHFVRFKKSYREVTTAEKLISIEEKSNYNKEIQFDRAKFDIYDNSHLRSVKISQKNLLEDGWDYPEDFEGDPFSKGSYHANKWGGKFLRAPDVFFNILEKNSEKFEEIGDIADDVQRGISTGANDFFFVRTVTDQINSIQEIENSSRASNLKEIEDSNLEVIMPSEFSEIESAELYVVDSQDLVPALQNTDEAEKLEINDLSKAIFVPNDTEISKPSQDYVEWGESKGFNTRYTCKRRDIWWDIRGHTTKTPTKIGFNYNIHDTGHFYFSETPCFYSDNFHTVDYSDNSIQVLGESTLGVMMINIFCRTPFGGGKAKLQTYELEEIPLPHPDYLDKEEVESAWKNNSNSEINVIFEEIGLEKNKPIREQDPDPLPARKELDDIVFDALGLSESERKEVYWAVAELVKARLDKAESV